MSAAASIRFHWPVTERPTSKMGWSICFSVLRFGICLELLFAVLAFGAVEDWSLAVVEVGSAALFLLWATQGALSGGIEVVASPLYWPAAAFALILAAQLGLNLTAYRYATLVASTEYIAYGILVFLTIQCLSDPRLAKTIIWVLTLFGSALAAFAIVQDLSPNGKIYWLRSVHHGGALFGPYVNHDHYAGLMEMLVPTPVLVSLSALVGGGKRVLVGFAGILMAGSVVLSESRAGTAACLLEMTLLVVILVRKKQNRGSLAMLGAICLTVVGLVAWVGTSAVWHHLGELEGWMRLSITRDGLRMFWHKPVVGWGLGTFATVYPEFRSFSTNKLVNAAHNDYVQILVETGVLGLATVACFVVAVFSRGLKNLDSWRFNWSRALGLGALIGVTGMLVHSAFDFNLEIPANACVFYFLCAIASSTQAGNEVLLAQLRELSPESGASTFPNIVNSLGPSTW